MYEYTMTFYSAKKLIQQILLVLYELWDIRINFGPIKLPIFIEVPVPSQESELSQNTIKDPFLAFTNLHLRHYSDIFIEVMVAVTSDVPGGIIIKFSTVSTNIPYTWSFAFIKISLVKYLLSDIYRGHKVGKNYNSEYLS
jgi:hypothetical protein